MVTPELADPLGALEVGQHEDVEQLGVGGDSWCVECGACGAGWQVPHYAESVQ